MTGVARQADGQHGREARVGHQQREPAVKEGRPRSVDLPQVDVASRQPPGSGPPVRHSKARRRSRPHPSSARRPGARTVSPGVLAMLGRRQEDPDTDHFTHDQRRRRRQPQPAQQAGSADVAVSSISSTWIPLRDCDQ